MIKSLFNDSDGRNRCWLINEGKLLTPGSLILQTDSPEMSFVLSVRIIGYNLDKTIADNRKLKSDKDGVIYLELDIVDKGLYLTGTIESQIGFFVKKVDVKVNGLTKIE